jgi:hypothetical protein
VAYSEYLASVPLLKLHHSTMSSFLLSWATWATVFIFRHLFVFNRVCVVNNCWLQDWNKLSDF